MSSTLNREAPASSPLLEAAAEASRRPTETPARSKSPTKKAWTKTMLWVRRIHLYSGLFMFPWVLMYGFTGMFFNHPRAFNGTDVTTFSGAEVAGGELQSVMSPEELAGEVVAAINEARNVAASDIEEGDPGSLRNASAAAPSVVLTDLRAPEFNRFFQFDVDVEGQTVLVQVDPLTGNGEVHVSSSGDHEDEGDAASPLADVRRVELESNTLTAVQEAVPGILNELDLPSGEATTGRLSPSLLFSAEVDGRPCAVSYNLGNGLLSVVPEGKQSDMNAKSFLQRLHLSRGYSPHWGVRTFWAICVDGMFVSMVFWGLSGIFMWWQIKRTRLLGAGVLVASAVCATLLVVGMHDNLTVAGRRGGRGGPSGQRGNIGGERGPQGGESTEGEFRGRGGRGGRGGFGRGRGGIEARGDDAPGSDPQDEQFERLYSEFEQFLESPEAASPGDPSPATDDE